MVVCEALASIAPITTIAAIVIIDIGRKYWSAIDCGWAVGEAVACAGMSKLTWVCAEEVKYEFDPANVAMTVYVPGMSGVIDVCELSVYVGCGLSDGSKVAVCVNNA